LHPVEASQPDPATERTTRHLRLCAELADLAMQLARAAAARTLADWAEPEASPPPEPHIAQPAAPFPQATEPHADRETAPAATPHRSTVYLVRPSAAKPTDPAVLFTRLAAVVRDCIALEARLAAAPTAASAARALTRRADPRRVPLREVFRRTTENHPDRAALTRDIAARLDEYLAADPDQTIAPAQILDAICDEFDIDIDFATLPDEYLFALSGTAEEAEDDLEPCATSPP
jgi:hypothetical protein